MSLTESEKKRLKTLIHEQNVEEAQEHLLDFTKLTFPKFESTNFHKNYYEVLNEFAEGRIKKLIISMPPQHGKSEGSTRRLPSYLLGINPDVKIAIATYSDTFAKKFNRDCQRIVDTKEYNEIFPNTLLNQSNVITISDSYLRNSSEFEIIGHGGSLKAIGKGGALTGNAVDIMIMDDLYKDYMEGNSPIIRNNVWDWYTTVVKTRLHNDSQEIIVFTRWNEDDLIGRLEKTEKVIEINSMNDLKDIPKGAWVKINYEAIKTTEKTELDPREKGEPLYPEKHDKESLTEKRALDPEKFECLYQGNPQSKEGLLYGDFKTYRELPSLKIKKNYTDTADSGSDYLCSINYGVPLDLNDNNIYILDILYSQDNMTVLEPLNAQLLNGINEALFESNNGGRYYATNVQESTNCVIDWFHQSKNKESRIFSNSASVQSRIVFPERWSIDYPDFYNHVTGYKKLFKANKHDDAADVLTGIIETETNNYDDLSVEWN